VEEANDLNEAGIKQQIAQEKEMSGCRLRNEEDKAKHLT